MGTAWRINPSVGRAAVIAAFSFSCCNKVRDIHNFAP
jgi:hypothetical protein